MLTLGPAAPCVNPAPTVAEHALADRLAWQADGGTPDDYRPGWDADPAAPSAEDDAYMTGLAIGRTGDAPTFLAVNDHLDRYPGVDAERAYYRGLLEGRRRHAFEAGRDLGLEGRPCVRPDAIHHRFDREVSRGWDAGAAERAERESILADFHARLDWEREYDLEQREIDKINREAGGWDRAINRSLV